MPVSVTIGGFTISGVAGFTWKIATGVSAYETVITVPNSWASDIRKLSGIPSTLVVGPHTIKNVYVLHEVPSQQAGQTSFAIADERYFWNRCFITRDFNITKRTGDLKNVGGIGGRLPLRPAVTAPVFGYKWYSLREGREVWTAREALESVLESLTNFIDSRGDDSTVPKPKSDPKPDIGPAPEPKGPRPRIDTKKALDDYPFVDNPRGKGGGGKGGGGKGGSDGGDKKKGKKTRRWVIDSLPFGGSPDKEISIQNVMLNGPADQALAQLLTAIPGAELYIGKDGVIHIFDATSYGDSKKLLSELPPATRRGQKLEKIQMAGLRPAKYRVYFMLEVELLLKFEQNMVESTALPARSSPWVKNVIPITDDSIDNVSVLDGRSHSLKSITAVAGTWVWVQNWLDRMEEDRKVRQAAGEVYGWPWNWETIRRCWLHGDLEGYLGGYDVSKQTNIAARVAALKQHFRRTMQVNPAYLDALRDFKAERLSIVDTATGMRAPAEVCGLVTLIPTTKGETVYFFEKKFKGTTGIYVELDTILNADDARGSVLPISVSMVDADQGIFRFDFIRDPIGLNQDIVMSGLHGPSGDPSEKTKYVRDLEKQKSKRFTSGRGFTVGSEKLSWGMFLGNRTKLHTIMSGVLGAPNNKARLYSVEIEPADLVESYGSDFNIEGGSGIVMELFIPPTETTARFQIKAGQEKLAQETAKRLLGVDKDDPAKAGLVDDPDTDSIDEGAMNGYYLLNSNVLRDVAKAAAAEAVISMADQLIGTVGTRGTSDLSLAGNVNSRTITVDPYPQAGISSTHQFTGLTPAMDRMSFLSAPARALVLGIISFKGP